MGHTKHRVAFGRKLMGPRGRLLRQMDLDKLEEEKQKSKHPSKMFESIRELFRRGPR